MALQELLTETRASRVTLRQDLPGDYAFPVTDEALADGARRSGTSERSTSHAAGRARGAERGQVVQDDCRRRTTTPAFQRMLETYGGVAAQIVTPVFDGDRLRAVVSVHQLGAASVDRRRDRGRTAPRRERRWPRVPPTMHNRWHPDLEPVRRSVRARRSRSRREDGLDGQLTRDSTHADCSHSTSVSAIRSPALSTSREPSRATSSTSSSSRTRPRTSASRRSFPASASSPTSSPSPTSSVWEIADGWSRSPQLPGVAVRGRSVRGVVGVAPSHELMAEIAAARRRSRQPADRSPTRCRRRPSLPRRKPACGRSRHARSAATSTSASWSRHRASGSGRQSAGRAALDRRPALRAGRRRGLRHRHRGRGRRHGPRRRAEGAAPGSRYPAFETPGRPGRRSFATTGIPVDTPMDVDVAAREALARDDRLPEADDYGFERAAAYALCSVAVDLRISEVVDVPYPLVWRSCRSTSSKRGRSRRGPLTRGAAPRRRASARRWRRAASAGSRGRRTRTASRPRSPPCPRPR